MPLVWLVEIAVVVAALVAAKTRLCRFSGCEIPREKFDAVGAGIAKASITMRGTAAPFSVGHLLLTILCSRDSVGEALQLPGFLLFNFLRALMQENHLTKHDIDIGNLLSYGLLVLLAPGALA